MFARVLLLSLAISLCAPAATIGNPYDWGALVNASLPPLDQPADLPLDYFEEPPPAFHLDLDSLLALALTFTYGYLDDTEVEGNVLAVITPVYDAWLAALAARGGYSNPVEAIATLPVTTLPVTTPPILDLPLTAMRSAMLTATIEPTPLSTTAVPEPAVCWLAAAGIAVIAFRYRQR